MSESIEVVSRPADKANYSSNRSGEHVSMLIIHVEEGGNEGTARWFADAAAHASAHYGIGRDGTVLSFVPEEAAAWHAGNAEFNRRSIGIELEGHTAEPKAFTPKMMESLVRLCTEIAGRYDIALDRSHIIGHCEVPDPADPDQLGGAGHHTDPGPHFPWDEFLAALVAAKA